MFVGLGLLRTQSELDKTAPQGKQRKKVLWEEDLLTKYTHTMPKRLVRRETVWYCSKEMMKEFTEHKVIWKKCAIRK